LLEGGERLDEVPFSLVERGVLLRGTIDCLVRRPDGSVAVIEFKSGRQEAWHADQLAVYVRAARLMFPGTAVEGRLIYA
jgi:RecB family exonuclease